MLIRKFKCKKERKKKKREKNFHFYYLRSVSSETRQQQSPFGGDQKFKKNKKKRAEFTVCIAYSSGQQLISQERGNKERLLPACLPPCLIINKVGFVTDPIKKTGLSSLSYCIQLIIFSFFDDVNTAQKQSDLKRQKTFFFSLSHRQKKRRARLSPTKTFLPSRVILPAHLLPITFLLCICIQIIQ